MKQLRIIKAAWRLLSLKKLKVILSITGIAVGIASVIILNAIGEGANNKLVSEIESMGSNLITIDAGKVKEVIGRKRQVEKATTLKLKDCKRLLEDCSVEIYAAPTQDLSTYVKYMDVTTKGRIIGTTPEYPSIRNFKLATGRFFTDEENIVSSRVAVVGTQITSYLFHGTEPLGEYIRINNIPFEIIGTLKPKGASYDGANEDEVIFIPLKTGMRRLFNVDYIKNIYVHVKEKDKIKKAQEEIRAILRESHKLDINNKEDDFTIQNMYTVIKAEEETNTSFSFLVLSIGALSLIVGGVGILAVMLLSVKERFSEIGLRMATGARKNDILFQFLIESFLLSITGGLVGVTIGIAGAFLINKFAHLDTFITIESILGSVIVSSVLGIFFGVYPARKASVIQPVKALKE